MRTKAVRNFKRVKGTALSAEQAGTGQNGRMEYEQKDRKLKNYVQ